MTKLGGFKGAVSNIEGRFKEKLLVTNANKCFVWG